MKNSKIYQVKLLPNFEKTYKSLVKERYNPSKYLPDFEKAVEDIIQVLSVRPRIPPPDGKSQPWPKNTYQPGWDFWKFYFICPGLVKDAREGRIMYLIHDETSVVQVFWIYTHADYAKRPHDHDIKKVIQSLVKP